jgi:putative transport protein
MTGALTSTAALGLVTRAARSELPALGYAGTYPFANIILALAGTILVRL